MMCFELLADLAKLAFLISMIRERAPARGDAPVVRGARVERLFCLPPAGQRGGCADTAARQTRLRRAAPGGKVLEALLLVFALKAMVGRERPLPSETQG